MMQAASAARGAAAVQGVRGLLGGCAMVYRFGECLLDTQQHRLQRAGQPLWVRAKVWQVLLYLLEHRERTVLKQELCEQVWPQQFISEATLESTVRAARRAIGDSGHAQQMIRTVYGYGYRFIMTVEEGSDLSSQAAVAATLPPPSSVSAPAAGRWPEHTTAPSHTSITGR
jgi:DNA-binding winged helix-turn-helix (wHTH) protein